MRVKKIISITSLIIVNINFILRNLYYSKKLSSIESYYENGIIFVPCNYKLFQHVIKISKKLSETRRLNFFDKINLFLIGYKTYFVVCDKLNQYKIIGYSNYYFNKRDVIENTIHRGYIGILPEYHGKGIGQEFDRIIINHFAKNTELKGISSRVSINNTASYKMHIKSGFVPVERYYDPFMEEEREYMICDLDKFRN